MNWHPIETAPQDGTPIRLFCPRLSEDGVIVGFWNAGKWFMRQDGPYPVVLKPTHWMPIPPPPTVNDSLTVPLDDDIDEPLGPACAIDNPECESCQ